jgi:hypothetical protein
MLAPLGPLEPWSPGADKRGQCAAMAPSRTTFGALNPRKRRICPPKIAVSPPQKPHPDQWTAHNATPSMVFPHVQRPAVRDHRGPVAPFVHHGGDATATWVRWELCGSSPVDAANRVGLDPFWRPRRRTGPASAVFSQPSGVVGCKSGISEAVSARTIHRNRPFLPPT